MAASWGGDIDMLQYSLKGEYGDGEQYEDAGAAKFNAEYGQAISMNIISTGDGASRSYFDAAGNHVASDATKDFKLGGALYIENSDVPGWPPSDFSVAEPAGWHCSRTEEDVEMDVENSTHKACYQDKWTGDGGP